MQHRYAGDVGDFGKYGLLRALFRGQEGRRLGVVWYLTEPEARRNDGKHDGYLRYHSQARRERYRSCDPGLYDSLAQVRQHAELTVDLIEEAGVLPDSTVFWNGPVPTFVGRAEGKSGQESRWAERDRWHRAAREKMEPAHCVFTDPDNGITFGDPRDVRQRKPSHKHSYWHEIADYLAEGKSVIAYHHLGRQKGGHAKAIQQSLGRISDLGWPAWALRFRRGTARVLFVIPASDDHRLWLRQPLAEFSESWADHCSSIMESGDAKIGEA